MAHALRSASHRGRKVGEIVGVPWRTDHVVSLALAPRLTSGLHPAHYSPAERLRALARAAGPRALAEAVPVAVGGPPYPRLVLLDGEVVIERGRREAVGGLQPAGDVSPAGGGERLASFARDLQRLGALLADVRPPTAPAPATDARAVSARRGICFGRR